jgi:hypothetical protein
MKDFNLRDESQPQTYALGLKEVWEVPEEKLTPGHVQHTLGWPLQSSILDKTYGGGFIYHMAPNKMLLGLVIGLDYENPYINPCVRGPVVNEAAAICLVENRRLKGPTKRMLHVSGCELLLGHFPHFLEAESVRLRLALVAQVEIFHDRLAA